MDHQFDSPHFATCGEQVTLWDETRNSPLHEFKWGAYGAHCVKFNPSERDLLAFCTTDKGIVLYDAASRQTVRKLVLDMESNCLAWNPMEPFAFTVGTSDYK